MLSITVLSVLSFSVTLSTATRLYISSYAGNVTTLDLRHYVKNDSYTLATLSSLTACLPDPSWLTLDPSRGILYCIGEQALNISLPGSLTAFTTHRNGTLHPISVQSTVNGGVNSVIYGSNHTSYMAIAHYGGSALSTFTLNSRNTTRTTPQPLQELHFNLSTPGPAPGRQLSPHPHQVLVDPSGAFVLAPDLGADLVRVFRIAPSGGLLTACPSLSVTPGSGPRHARFSGRKEHYCPPQGPRHEALYLVSELADTLSAFNVSYPTNEEGCLTFKEIETQPTLQQPKVPYGAGAEIHITGDFLLLSDRNDSSSAGSLDAGTNSSDTLATYSLAPNGEFAFLQRSPAYGSFPRSFTLNAKGNLAAVGLQKSGRVVVIKRDVQTGLLGSLVADVGGLRNVTSVVWDE